MKICFLLSTLVYDGIKRSVVHFANAMQEMGHEVWLGVLHEWPGKLSLRSELRLPSSRIVSWEGLGQGRREWAMFRFFQHEKFDVVHANTIKMNHVGRWTALAAGVPCIVASEDNLCLNRSWKTRLEDLILAQLTHAVVMISQSVAESFLDVEKLPPQKVHVVYYGIPWREMESCRLDAERIQNKRNALGIPSGPTVVCAARLHFSKSLDTLVEAARRVVDRLPNAQFLLAGDGEELKKLEERRNQLGLARNFHFLGARDDIYEILQLADVVTLCSLWEGLGFSLMEGMAFGKPLVGTDVSGINEIILPGRNGFLVPPRSPFELARALLSALENLRLARGMGEESRRVLEERFDVKTNARHLLSLYEKILEPPLRDPSPWTEW